MTDDSPIRRRCFTYLNITYYSNYIVATNGDDLCERKSTGGAIFFKMQGCKGTSFTLMFVFVPFCVKMLKSKHIQQQQQQRSAATYIHFLLLTRTDIKVLAEIRCTVPSSCTYHGAGKASHVQVWRKAIMVSWSPSIYFFSSNDSTMADIFLL